MVVIGIDPGLTGALACISDDGTATLTDLPTISIAAVKNDRNTTTRRIDVRELRSLVLALVPPGSAVMVVLEELATGGGAKRPQNAMSIGSQHRTRGNIEAVFELLGAIPKTVRPQEWKKLYGAGKDKNGPLETARILYPDLQPDLKRVKDHNRAEALLIAHWGRKMLA